MLQKTHCNGCMNVAWAMFWGGSRSTKPCVFPCKVVAAGDERYLVCAAVRLRSFCARIVPPNADTVVRVVLLFLQLSGCRSHCSGCQGCSVPRLPCVDTTVFCS